MKNRILFLLLCISIFFSTQAAIAGQDSLTLHYDRPATYFEEALVIGNGRLGATIYGGTRQDRISLNDITLWTGEPDREVYSPDAYKAIPEIRAALDREDYRTADKLQRKVQGHYSENYQPLGTLTINYLDRREQISGYRRELDISNATAATVYQVVGHAFTSSYFASAPDSVLVVRLRSDDDKGIHALLSLSSLLPHGFSAQGNEVAMDGYAAYHSEPQNHGGKHFYDPERGMRFRTLLRVVSRDGCVKSYATGEIKVEGCHEVLVLVANATSFNGFDKDPACEGRDYTKIVQRQMDNAAAKSYDELYKAHVADYKSLFDRMSLTLGHTDSALSSLPTDRQLFLYSDKQQQNPELEALYFQYGRYLLIASSRTPGVPANLQGLWNEKILPPWCSNYTLNINLEENYWAAEAANLSELHFPLLDFVSSLSRTGETTARSYYGVEQGWCTGHNSDLWAMSCPVGLRGAIPIWANWTMGGAWLSTHIWEHYQYTLDKDFLRKYYPVLRGAAVFCLNWLIEKDGHLLTSPGTSPENKFLTPNGYAGSTLYGNTSDIAITRQCLLDTRWAAQALNTDKELVSQIDGTLSRLLPYRIGKAGNLQEWYHDWRDQEPHHRHQAHLYGLYPGHQISVAETPELAAGCVRTLELRGTETTGWSTGWRINLYARLRDGEKAYQTYRKLLQYVSPDNYQGKDARRGGGTYPNLLDAHPPFQIDGNFGGCAGVLEMLVQSSLTSVTLLPALPDAWQDGKVKGVCARGGFTIDMTWRGGKVTSLSVYSKKGGKTILCFNGLKKRIRLKPGEWREIL